MNSLMAWCSLSLLFIPPIFGHYTTIPSKVDHVIFAFPNQIRDESGLPECSEAGQVCGMVHSRYWMPPIVSRHCTCPQGLSSCSLSTRPDDNHSIPLNNKAHLKVCEEVDSLEVCGEAQVGLEVSEQGADQRIVILCSCSWPAYWRLRAHRCNATYTIDTYTCTKLGQCEVGDFCGHMREDTWSAYYQCSCPRGSLCINSDRTLYNTSELLYSGPAYRAYCTPVTTNN